MPDANEINERLALLEADNRWIKNGVASIEENTRETAKAINQLVQLEERTGNMSQAIERAFKAIEAEARARQTADQLVSTRVTLIEEEMPTIKLARRVVFGGVALLLSQFMLLGFTLVYVVKNT